MNQFAAIGCLTTLVTVTASAVPVTVPRTDFARSNVAYVSGSDVRQFTGLTALQDAKSAAVGGNTIFVGPGIYSANDLSKNNVNWHFFDGAVVFYTNQIVTDASAIFDDNGVACTNSVSGDG